MSPRSWTGWSGSCGRSPRSRSWRASGGGPMPDRLRRYPRTARVNEVVREVLAEELERLADTDERIGLLTITAVKVDPDLRHATVLLASLADEPRQALEEDRVRLQAAVGRQLRLK